MKKRQQGFSLIELLVVIAIIGILAAVGTISYSRYTKTAQKSVAQNNYQNVYQYLQSVGQLITSGLDTSGGLNGDTSTNTAIASAIESSLSSQIKNPYNSDEAAVVVGQTLTDCLTSSKGVISLEADGDSAIIISSCYSDDVAVVSATIVVK